MRKIKTNHELAPTASLVRMLYSLRDKDPRIPCGDNIPVVKELINLGLVAGDWSRLYLTDEGDSIISMYQESGLESVRRHISSSAFEKYILTLPME